jgi:hypothetical protein
MFCESCKREVHFVVPWQRNCTDCWNQNWHGFPSPAELRACVLGSLGDGWVCASDLVNRSQMAAAMWPQLAMMAMSGEVEIARWEPEMQRYVCGPPYSDRAYVRRRIAE